MMERQMDPQYEEIVENGTFTLRFRAAKQLLLHPEFEQMVWDECLRRAHMGGHMPVGPIFISTAEADDNEPTTSELAEGEALVMHRVVLDTPFGQHSVEVIVVTAQVQLGLSL
jgi:hypothetical protein